MKSTARFSVDPRLSALLGESYTSSERALRELVDNAWDAEARVVKITLPDILSEEPVIIEDDGHGMKNQEVRQEYLKIASPRFSRKGERTPNLDRKVKGRRGIGKFSGLTIGDIMEIVTRAQGVKTTLLISKELLLEAGKDIEEVDLPIAEEPCDPEAHGTTITIRKLNPRLSFPQPDKLREQVAYDYGRETGFQVQINGEPVLRHDVQGTTFTKEYEMPDGTKAEATWTVTEKPLPGRKAGLILRSGDKSVGKTPPLGTGTRRTTEQPPDQPGGRRGQGRERNHRTHRIRWRCHRKRQRPPTINGSHSGRRESEPHRNPRQGSCSGQRPLDTDHEAALGSRARAPPGHRRRETGTPDFAQLSRRRKRGANHHPDQPRSRCPGNGRILDCLPGD